MNAEMHIENGKMVYGKRECSNCHGEGRKPSALVCDKCKGTGNGPRGGKGQCRKCYGSGHTYTNETRVTCPTCKGINSHACEQATQFDYMPKPVWESFEFRVLRSSRPQTWNEAYLGLGSVFSATDYGRHKNQTNEEIIDHVRKTGAHQACKVTRDDGTVANYIAILTSDNGYVVLAVFDGPKQ